MRFIKIKRHMSDPVQTGGIEITTVSRSVTLQPPGRGVAVFSWVRPEAIRLSMEGRPERTLRVPDRTRRMQVLTVALHLASVFLIAKMMKLISRRKR